MKHTYTLSISLPTLVGSALVALMCVACGHKSTAPAADTTDSVATVGPAFSEDSAYHHIKVQCDFGPRTMNSEAHEHCGQYIARELERLGCKVTLQRATFTRFDGLRMKGYNIIAETRPEATKRILICTHWDSRPWCDQDPDSTKWHTPVLAANDGASGVGVILELARLIKQDSLPYGVDFVCFDAEDVGQPQWEDQGGEDESDWCLGAQYWARHPHTGAIKYGILLDMVGGVGAHFYQEGYSQRYANDVVTRVWDAARSAGYGDFFPQEQGGYITDDHLPLNRVLGLPTIDIIPYYPTSEPAFGPTWHTSQDNLDNISTATLKAVGQTLVQLLYSQSDL